MPTQTLPYRFRFAAGSPHLSGGYFHALTLVIFVFFIILVRSGCDEAGLFSFCMSLGLNVYGCLDWFPIRGSCLSLSLIGDYI